MEIPSCLCLLPSSGSGFDADIIYRVYNKISTGGDGKERKGEEREWKERKGRTY